jgi:phage terminase small subunit
MGGRPKKPTAILRAQGTYTKTRHEDRFEGDAITQISSEFIPERLQEKPVALHYWKMLIAESSKINGYILNVDAAPLERYCLGLQELVDVGDPERTIINVAGNIVANPEWKAKRILNAELLAIENKFGFSPVARTSITLDKSEKEEEDSFKI